tara:strand:+ start:224 stop:484 length:261 start_codon:yes stop_codon:yes gene_type:complete
MTEEVNINDIKSVLSILNVCTQRGVFKVEELEGIGKLYNKLNKFVNNVTEQLLINQQKINNEDNKDNEDDSETGGHSMNFDNTKVV